MKEHIKIDITVFYYNHELTNWKMYNEFLDIYALPQMNGKDIKNC
jgi:hypothetical protein